MTSVRPKLKPDTPKAVTAWETATGQNVWMTASGSWTQDVSQIAAFTGDEAEARLAEAMAQEGIVTDPYFMEVTETGEITGRETLRETIRAKGPTVSYGEGA
tara:strand:+ start:1475 stop:1780 length:306 start_codon:yes stop_codon:yes gene_type:complete